MSDINTAIDGEQFEAQFGDPVIHGGATASPTGINASSRLGLVFVSVVNNYELTDGRTSLEIV